VVGQAGLAPGPSTSFGIHHTPSLVEMGWMPDAELLTAIEHGEHHALDLSPEPNAVF
jgi:hypothetical protein